MTRFLLVSNLDCVICNVLDKTICIQLDYAQKCTSNNQLHQGEIWFSIWYLLMFHKIWIIQHKDDLRVKLMALFWVPCQWELKDNNNSNHAIWPKSDSQLPSMGNLTAMECLHGNIKKHSIMKQCTLFFAGDTYTAMSIGMPKSKWSLSRLAEALNPSCKLKCYLCRHVHYLHTTKPTDIRNEN